MRRALTIALIAMPGLARGQVCVAGRVVDAITAHPVAGVAVKAATADMRKQRLQNSRQTTTDSAGSYRLCVPPGSSALLEAIQGPLSAYLPIVTPSADSTLDDLRLPVGGDTGSAIVTGRVLSETGSPVAGASVVVLGGHINIPTSNDGAFGLRAPAGSQVLVVRRIGLGAAVVPVELSATEPREVHVTMQRTPPTMAQINVIADRTRLEPVYAAIGFTTRQRIGFGHFMTAEDIDNRHDDDTPQLFRGMPGVALKYDHNNVLHVYSARGKDRPEEYGKCTAYFVDGLLLGNGRSVYTVDPKTENNTGPEDETQLPRPGDLIAIEVYQDNEPAPVAVGVVDRCLKILLWTKAMIDRK
jgi:Carboxypeptidase regulatory-like domain